LNVLMLRAGRRARPDKGLALLLSTGVSPRGWLPCVLLRAPLRPARGCEPSIK
jgi:hypothetical protein